MPFNTYDTSRLTRQTTTFGEYDSGCDPDFDDGFAELEREFAKFLRQACHE